MPKGYIIGHITVNDPACREVAGNRRRTADSVIILVEGTE
jgi:hypothetical protein